LFPEHIGTYWEPFLGGGAVVLEVMRRCIAGVMRVDRFVLSDTNADLVLLYTTTVHSNSDTESRLA
jgi:site-specific DNA-adenine methylase